MYCKIVYKKWYQGIKINNTIYLMTRYDYYIWISLFLFVRCAHGIKSFTRYSQKLKVNVVLSLPDIPYKFTVNVVLSLPDTTKILSQRCFTITRYFLIILESTSFYLYPIFLTNTQSTLVYPDTPYKLTVNVSLPLPDTR